MQGKQELERFLTETIHHSCERRKLSISLPTREYVVTLLEGIIKTDSLVTEFEWNREHMRGFEPITFKMQRAAADPKELKSVGDHCLIFVGFFYGFVQKQGDGQAKYYCETGQTAYAQYGAYQLHRNLQTQGFLFREMAKKFIDVGKIIGDIELENMDEKKLYRLLALYEATKDERYAEMLRTSGIFLEKVGLS
ncbi:MAG TPA: hypothetical protein VJJ79_02505 [Candidatus Nanoarchaeia archaeon]|nr:hypothetical protein [Candidatus Nanoarchaeia archaeon]